MKCHWKKIVKSEDASAISECLRNVFGLEYTGGWYSVYYPVNSHIYCHYAVTAEPDDLTMLELGFTLLSPVIKKIES